MVTQARPQTKGWVIDPAHSSVEFAVKHMVITTVRGRFTQWQADIDFDEAAPERSRVEARIAAASIDTKEAQRDTHLRSPDFLDAEKFPQLTFKSRRIEAPGKNHYRLVGDLTIRDVTREVTLDTTLAGFAKDPWGNQRAGLTVEASLNRKDFGLNWNVALEAGGLLVGDTVKIYIEAELIQKPA